MRRYVVMDEGCVEGCIRYTLEEAAAKIARIHERGGRWDARVKTTGQGFRVLTPDEAAVLISAVALEVAAQ